MIDNNPKTVCAIGMSNIVMTRFYGFFFFCHTKKRKKKLIFDRSALILINLF